MRTLLFLLLAGVSLFPSGAWGQAGIACQTTADWGTGFSAQVTITNSSASPISNWALQFDLGRQIDSIWNAQVANVSGTQYLVTGLDWDSSIAANSPLSFGFNGSPGNLACGSASFQLSSSGVSTQPTPSPSPGSIQVTITQTALWQGGFSAAMVVANTGSTSLNGWTLSFTFDQSITSLWNGSLQQQGSVYTVASDATTAALPAGGSATLGFTGSGALDAASAQNCMFNGTPCTISTVIMTSAAPVANPIQIGALDKASPATQITVPMGQVSYPLEMANGAPANFSVSSNSPQVATAQISGANLLFITGNNPGRASLRLQDTVSGSVRFIGVRVQNADGTAPAMPPHLALGSVSEDTTGDLTFWQSTQTTGPLADIRYIYLNGGPFAGWDTWSDQPAGRAIDYIRNSRMMGLIPFFVFYNIPDASEGYLVDLAHVGDASYMSAYFANLKLALDTVNNESPDDVVGMILEPDFLGYLAQNDPRPISAIPAMTHTIYDSGVLSKTADPYFGDTVAGLVAAVNYTISKLAPQVLFGWQMNLWASPAGGWTTTVPGNGIIHKTDTAGITPGRTLIYNEAAAITNYYLQAGVAGNHAAFLSIDKYGLDATGFEQSAAANPAASTWFWNYDLWENYLTFVRAMRDTSHLPIVLWQLPVGHINSTQAFNPASAAGTFPDLTESFQSYEDSAPAFFFGDTFVTSGARFQYFSTYTLASPAVSSSSNNSIAWSAGMSDAAAAGVAAALFGAGVGISTTNIGAPPSDGYWWALKAQQYLLSPVPAGSGKSQ